MLLMTLRARPTTRVQLFGHIFGRVQQANSRFLQHRSSSFITTPIYYVNASPHIGHLYSSLLADVTNRWQEICGYSGAIFSTGTDEHGLKVQQAAAFRGYSPKVFCDRVSSDFKSIFDLCDISYTDFVRTTEERHRRAVESFWTKLYSAGYIYEGNYKGWYSMSEESFLTPGQVTDAPDGNGLKKISIESGQPVHWTTEHNYMFRLSEFGPRLLQWIDKNQRAIYPTIFADIVREWIQGGLQDLSVSRQRDRLQWGIPVPDDPSQTVCFSFILHVYKRQIQQHEPWTLVKNQSDENKAWLDTIIHVAMESLRICSLLLQPVIPSFCDRLLTRLGIPGTERTSQHFSIFPAFEGQKIGYSLRKLGVKDSVMFKKVKD
ncbi:methionine--tRNA ligase, mitochondrial-like [Anneissia japonica]|uniref:methionine--tRNA ligase, mitochondrial-like n=1 Tax=Anneissia japonica TaxID=1529436 RepID=UPI001425A8EA|nr:methionine--tRNA ligase, mitochondrial-like [Anneissia japonica]